jgi:hypothetical protein
MRHARIRKIGVSDSAPTKRSRSLVSWSVLIVAVLIGGALLTAAVRAYNHGSSELVRAPRTSAPRVAQDNPQQRGKSYSRLSHQPEAESLRRALGLRFLGPGREKTTLTGTLTIGTDQSPVRIVRTQTDDGEQVEIAIGAGGSSLTWNSIEGPRVDASRALGNIRAIIERLALDSPDQFLLAQLRGASYYTVARNVMPKSAAGSEDYAGPTWNVVRVGEPDAAGPDATLSKARSFHINTTTGLIDRCFSQEGGDTIVAEMSGWTDRLGEKAPTHITWNKNGQVVIELSLNGVGYGPKQ